jgi:hypothetical protein
MPVLDDVPVSGTLQAGYLLDLPPAVKNQDCDHRQAEGNDNRSDYNIHKDRGRSQGNTDLTE